ncbi:hypothetical protein Tco_0995820, partial [Tanacetum coccineum]
VAMRAENSGAVDKNPQKVMPQNAQWHQKLKGITFDGVSVGTTFSRVAG